MIKVNKVVEIIVDGKEVQTLTDVCLIARIALQKMRMNFHYVEGAEEGGYIDSMITTILDAQE